MMGLCVKYAKLMVVVVLVGQLLVAPTLGSGPRVDPVALPIWNFAVNDTTCSVFRNKTALLPFFKVWPEDIPDLHFKYCCEYQADDNSVYNLSTYRYGEGEGALEPRPYYDLGIVDQYTMYWKQWGFWNLPLRHNAVLIRCDMTDLQRLYEHRFWKTMARGAKIGAVLIGCLLFLVFVNILVYECFVPSDGYSRVKDFMFEELFSDMLHLLLLAFMGSLMMEAVGHSRLRGWRSQIMYNTGVVYTYLSLFAFLSACVRHCVSPSRHHVKDWRWQKVFGQLGALFLVGAYLNLVDDPSGQALDSYAGIVLAAVVAACIWSSGVEMLVIAKMATPLTKEEQTKKLEALARRRDRYYAYESMWSPVY